MRLRKKKAQPYSLNLQILSFSNLPEKLPSLSATKKVSIRGLNILRLNWEMPKTLFLMRNLFWMTIFFKYSRNSSTQKWLKAIRVSSLRRGWVLWIRGRCLIINKWFKDDLKTLLKSLFACPLGKICWLCLILMKRTTIGDTFRKQNSSQVELCRIKAKEIFLWQISPPIWDFIRILSSHWKKTQNLLLTHWNSIPLLRIFKSP